MAENLPEIQAFTNIISEVNCNKNEFNFACINSRAKSRGIKKSTDMLHQIKRENTKLEEQLQKLKYQTNDLLCTISSFRKAISLIKNCNMNSKSILFMLKKQNEALEKRMKDSYQMYKNKWDKQLKTYESMPIFLQLEKQKNSLKSATILHNMWNFKLTESKIALKMYRSINDKREKALMIELATFVVESKKKLVKINELRMRGISKKKKYESLLKKKDAIQLTIENFRIEIKKKFERKISFTIENNVKQAILDLPMFEFKQSDVPILYLPSSQKVPPSDMKEPKVDSMSRRENEFLEMNKINDENFDSYNPNKKRCETDLRFISDEFNNKADEKSVNKPKIQILSDIPLNNEQTMKILQDFQFRTSVTINDLEQNIREIPSKIVTEVMVVDNLNFNHNESIASENEIKIDQEEDRNEVITQLNDNHDENYEINYQKESYDTSIKTVDNEITNKEFVSKYFNENEKNITEEQINKEMDIPISPNRLNDSKIPNSGTSFKPIVESPICFDPLMTSSPKLNSKIIKLDTKGINLMSSSRGNAEISNDILKKFLKYNNMMDSQMSDDTSTPLTSPFIYPGNKGTTPIYEQGVRGLWDNIFTPIADTHQKKSVKETANTKSSDSLFSFNFNKPKNEKQTSSFFNFF